MTDSKTLLVLAVATTACGGKKSMTQGKVNGEHLACKTTEIAGRFDCATPLRDYFRTNGDAHIAGVNVIYGEGRDELLIWSTQSDAWPKASALNVDNHECSPPSGGDAGCATVIDELAQAKSRKRHYFIVPVFGMPDRPAPPGTWSVLDIHSATSGASGDTGWESMKTEMLRCRLEPGQPLLADLGEGVMHAAQVGSDYVPDGSEYASDCAPVLINYLRAHPEEHVAGVIALDGTLMKRVGGSDVPGDLGTVALLVLVGSAPWPKSSSLSVTEIACVDRDCAPFFAKFRPELKASPRVLFTLPKGDERQEQPISDELLVISVVE